MSKYEDDVMELIKTMAENIHHNAVKPFGRGVMPKGQMIDPKSTETSMLLERIKKMVKYNNFLMDRLNIHNGYEGLAPLSLQEVSPCANCSRFVHVKLDCPVMVIQAQESIDKARQEAQVNRDDQIFQVYTRIIILTLFFQ